MEEEEPAEARSPPSQADETPGQQTGTKQQWWLQLGIFFASWRWCAVWQRTVGRWAGVPLYSARHRAVPAGSRSYGRGGMQKGRSRAYRLDDACSLR
jgi:hypothetical protein